MDCEFGVINRSIKITNRHSCHSHSVLQEIKVKSLYDTTDANKVRTFGSFYQSDYDNFEYCQLWRILWNDEACSVSLHKSGGFIPAAYVSPSYIITSEPEHTGHTGHSGAKSRTQGLSVKDVCHKELHASAIKHLAAPARTNIQHPPVYWKLNALTAKMYFSLFLCSI